MITQKTIADDLGISTATLKNWVHALNLTPPRHRSGRTKYDQQFIEVLYKIKGLRDKGTGLQTIRELIQDNGGPAPTQKKLKEPISHLMLAQSQLKSELKELKQNKICQLEQQNQRLLEEIIDLHKELKKRPSHKAWEEAQSQMAELKEEIINIKHTINQSFSQRIVSWMKGLFF